MTALHTPSKRMYFTGKRSQQLVKRGLESLLFGVNNMIVTCPDREHYAVEVAAYENEAAQIRNLLKRFTPK